MNFINLSENNLIELTESNLINLCELKEFKQKELEELYLTNNELTNINFIQKNTHFINLKKLSLGWNKITDISNIKYLPNLELLDIRGLKLKDENNTVDILKKLSNLNILMCGLYSDDNSKTFKTYSIGSLRIELPNIRFY